MERILAAKNYASITFGVAKITFVTIAEMKHMESAPRACQFHGENLLTG